ncbi:MAG: 2Fe-2S iron-sulfur cluster binding domain-containing protein [Deltaproteobacteria bacterium]|nr:2Fe-2S iron-sulfur cluster binding domain-containing protein [Deltaproteobacteria bacterium]
MLRNFLKRPKSFPVSFETLKEEIDIKRGETILSAGLDNGLVLPHGCRVGSCGNCRCRLVEGKVKALTDPSYILSAEELKSGYILTCQSQPRSALRIVYDDYDPDAAIISSSLVRGEVICSRNLTHDILEIKLKIDENIRYYAGQYAEVYFPSIDVKRSYSFAEAPKPGGKNELCFHIRHVPGGKMTDWLHGKDRTGEKVRVTAPFGTFWLRSTDRPILCVAGGSGMAPIKALLEYALARGCVRPVTYFYGARTQADLYCLEEMKELQSRWKASFKFIPVLSDEPSMNNWGGETGLVTDAVSAFDIRLDDHEAYLCGPPGMIDATIKLLGQAGLGPENIYYDKFLDARDAPPTGNAEMPETNK